MRTAWQKANAEQTPSGIPIREATQRQRQKQVFFGNDNKKDKSNGNKGNGCGWSDAVGVGTPRSHRLLNLFWGEVFDEGAVEEGGEFGVRGEAEGDELGEGKGVGGFGLRGGEKALVAEVFFEADEAVLDALGVGAGLEAGEEEGGGEEDDPHAEGQAGGVGDRGPDDADEDVEEEEEQGGGVDGVASGVVLVGLGWGGHGGSLRGGMSGLMIRELGDGAFS